MLLRYADSGLRLGMNVEVTSRYCARLPIFMCLYACACVLFKRVFNVKIMMQQRIYGVTINWLSLFLIKRHDLFSNLIINRKGTRVGTHEYISLQTFTPPNVGETYTFFVVIFCNGRWGNVLMIFKWALYAEHKIRELPIYIFVCVYVCS